MSLGTVNSGSSFKSGLLRPCLQELCIELRKLQRTCKNCRDRSFPSSRTFDSSYKKNSDHMSSLVATYTQYPDATVNTNFTANLRATTAYIKEQNNSLEQTRFTWNQTRELEERVLDIQYCVATKMDEVQSMVRAHLSARPGSKDVGRHRDGASPGEPIRSSCPESANANMTKVTGADRTETRIVQGHPTEARSKGTHSRSTYSTALTLTQPDKIPDAVSEDVNRSSVTPRQKTAQSGASLSKPPVSAKPQRRDSELGDMVDLCSSAPITCDEKHTEDMEQLREEKSQAESDLEKEKEKHNGEMEKLRAEKSQVESDWGKEKEMHKDEVEKLREEKSESESAWEKKKEEHRDEMEKLLEEKSRAESDLKKEKEKHNDDIEQLRDEKSQAESDRDKEKEEHKDEMEKLRREKSRAESDWKTEKVLTEKHNDEMEKLRDEKSQAESDGEKEKEKHTEDMEQLREDISQAESDGEKEKGDQPHAHDGLSNNSDGSGHSRGEHDCGIEFEDLTKSWVAVPRNNDMDQLLELKKLLNDNSARDMELATLRERTKQSETMSDRYEKLESEMMEALANVKKLTDHLEGANSERQSAEAESKRLLNEKDDQETKLSTLRDKCDKLDKEKAEALATISKLTDHMNESQMQKQNNDLELKEMLKENSHQETEIVKLNLQIKASEDSSNNLMLKYTKLTNDKARIAGDLKSPIKRTPSKEELQQKETELRQNRGELKQEQSDKETAIRNGQYNEQELHKKENELRQKQGELNEEQSNKEKALKNGQYYEQELQKKENEMRQKQEELQKKENELRQKQGELKEEQANKEKAIQNGHYYEQELQKKENELRQKQGELKEEQANKENAIQNGQYYEQELQKKENELRQRLGELKEEQANKEKAIQNGQYYEQELQKKENELRQKQGELKEEQANKEKTMKNGQYYEQELQKKENELRQKQVELQKKENELRQKQEELQKKENELRQKQELLQTKSDELRDTKTKLAVASDQTRKTDSSLQQTRRDLQEMSEKLHQERECSQQTIVGLKRIKRENEETIQKYLVQLHVAQDEARIASEEVHKHTSGEVQKKLDKVTTDMNFYKIELQKIDDERKEAERKRNEVLVVSCLLLNETGMAANFKTARDDFMRRVATRLKEQKKSLQIFEIPPSGELPVSAANMHTPCVLIMPCLAVSRVTTSIDSLMAKPAAKAGHTLLFVVFHPRAPHDRTVAPSTQQIGSLPPSCEKLVDVVFNRSNGGIFDGGPNDTAASDIANYLRTRPAEGRLS